MTDADEAKATSDRVWKDGSDTLIDWSRIRGPSRININFDGFIEYTIAVPDLAKFVRRFISVKHIGWRTFASGDMYRVVDGNPKGDCDDDDGSCEAYDDDDDRHADADCDKDYGLGYGYGRGANFSRTVPRTCAESERAVLERRKANPHYDPGLDTNARVEAPAHLFIFRANRCNLILGCTGRTYLHDGFVWAGPYGRWVQRRYRHMFASAVRFLISHGNFPGSIRARFDGVVKSALESVFAVRELSLLVAEYAWTPAQISPPLHLYRPRRVAEQIERYAELARAE